MLRAARSIVLRRAIGLPPLLALCACAHQPPAPEFITPPGAEFVSQMFGYSQAVRVGPWVFVSGQVGFDTKTRGFPPDLKKQVELSFANLEAVLKLAGAKMTDVVEITTYQLDMSRFDDVVSIHNDVFGDHRPAWSAIGVSALALPDIQFEVAALAYAPKQEGQQQAAGGDNDKAADDKAADDKASGK